MQRALESNVNFLTFALVVCLVYRWQHQFRQYHEMRDRSRLHKMFPNYDKDSKENEFWHKLHHVAKDADQSKLDKLTTLYLRKMKQQKGCEQFKDKYPPFTSEARATDVIQVFPDLKLIFCFVHKSGSTNTRRLILEMLQDKPASTLDAWAPTVSSPSKRRVAKNLADFSLTEQRRILRTYVKAVVVRRHADRMWSFYSDRMMMYGDRWLADRRYTPLSDAYVEANAFVSLRRFAQLTDLPDNLPLDELVERYNYTHLLSTFHRLSDTSILGASHIVPTISECMPCDIDYDLIFDLPTYTQYESILFEAIGQKKRPLRTADGESFVRSWQHQAQKSDDGLRQEIERQKKMKKRLSAEKPDFMNLVEKTETYRNLYAEDNVLFDFGQKPNNL